MIKHMLASAALALTLSTLGSGVQAANKKVWRIHYIVLARGLDPFDLTVKQDFPSAAACEEERTALQAKDEAVVVKQFGEGTQLMGECIERIAGAPDPKVFRSRITIVEANGTAHLKTQDKAMTAEECAWVNAVAKPTVAAAVEREYPGATILTECVRGG
jgi:hypothetical protein